MTQRRSFISSLVAAVALSPLFCGFLRGIGFSGVSRDKRPPLELWEMESNWDGTLSPYFKGKYGLMESGPKKFSVIHSSGEIYWCDINPISSTNKLPSVLQTIYGCGTPKIGVYESGREPDEGSFVDIVLPKC